ncbi:hypothetical protein [Jatrophihabitans fulvus]
MKRLLATTLALLLAAGVLATPSQAAAKRKIALILDYTVAKKCTVYPNYPKSGVIGNKIGWTIQPGDTVGWRYNVNKTWSVVSDKKYRNTKHFWWGFTRRSCIGTSRGGEHFPTPTSSYPKGVRAPSRILSGRSAITKSHYRHVDFPPSASPKVKRVKVKSFGTLRDHPGDFVVGNVKAGWHVDVTRSGDSHWVKVYVPNAKRWGYMERTHL